MASLLDLSGTNLSYYTVPAAFFLCMVPHTLISILAGKNYDLAYPRNTTEHCAKDPTIDKKNLRRIQRAAAAFSNGIESLGVYAGAVVAANTAGVPTARLNTLTLGYLATRVVYNFVYIVLQDNRRFAPLRSLTWMVGSILTTSLYVLAGNAVNSAAK